MNFMYAPSTWKLSYGRLSTYELIAKNVEHRWLSPHVTNVWSRRFLGMAWHRRDQRRKEFALGCSNAERASALSTPHNATAGPSCSPRPTNAQSHGRWPNP